MTPHKIIVVGGGTAGIMSATYFKAYWGNLVDVTVVYDHSSPGIGVGESLTPTFDTYLKRVGITTQDLIENCHATIKLGLKFKNWTKNSTGYHSFPLNQNIEDLTNIDLDFYLPEAGEILNNNFQQGISYNDLFFETNKIPSNDLSSFRHALHVDANKLGRYIEWRFKDYLNIVDGVVETVNFKNNKIDSLILKNGNTITGDLFIDCSGYQRLLISKLTSDWVDISKDLPTDRTIPNPLFKEFDTIPVYTTAEATKDGWILDVPLSNRHGTGYVYSSKFTSDDEAKKEFNSWLLKNYNTELQSDRVIKFKNGYHKKSWVNNCLSIGLSSGFIEPLEATSIHLVVIQLEIFAKLYNLNSEEENFNQEVFNTEIRNFYENAFQYIRFFYDTNRTDSEFWKYMTNNRPQWLKNLNKQLSNGFINDTHFSNSLATMFSSLSFINIGYYHNKFNPTAVRKYLENKHLYNRCLEADTIVTKNKTKIFNSAVDHTLLIRSILSKINI